MIENTEMDEAVTQVLQILDELAELAKGRINAAHAETDVLRQKLSDLEHRCKAAEAILHKIIPELEILVKETDDATC
jgi:hypothetical protein